MLVKYSIRAKIIMVVAFLLVALTGMGLLSVSSMRSINAKTVDIATGWLPCVRMLGELRSGVIQYRNAVRDHLLGETVEDKAETEKRLAGIVEKNDKIRRAYEPLITTPEERAIYNEWVTTWNNYRQRVEEVLALSRKAAGRYPHEAQELNAKTVNKIASDADRILDRDIDLNNTGADKWTAEAAASYNSAFWVLAIILVAAVVFGILVSIYLIRDVSSGIASIVKPMQALGQGDLFVEIPHCGEKTEIGLMADALQVFKEALIAKKAADETAARDADEKIKPGHRVDTITREFEAMIGEIVNTVSSASSQLESSAGKLSATAERSQRFATTVASASEEASTNVQSVASATEEMAASVTEISRQVQESARMAGDAVGQARTTTERVSELSKAATRIGDVVELIKRAGEAGRGFAVVASEVKALAEQTAKATGEIGTQISGIQAATQESVNAIGEISDTIEKLSEISSTIAAAVEEQGAATQEIARNVQQAAQGTQQVSSNITDVQRGATETGSASSQVLSAAQILSGDSGRLRSEVSKFVTSVRTA